MSGLSACLCDVILLVCIATQFDNSYFSDVPETDEDLLKLPTDSALFKDDKFRPIALKYKKVRMLIDHCYQYSVIYHAGSALCSRPRLSDVMSVSQIVID